MNDRLIWMWLSLHFGAGSRIYQKLYNHFGTVEAIYDSDDSDVALMDWLNISNKKKLLDKNLSHAEEVLEWCSENNVGVVTPSDSNYPEPLRLIEDYPAVIYYKGKLPDFKSNLFISVVGTRKMSIYGQKNAYELGFGLAKGGATVISGMALGIDCTAQKGALYAGGSSIAVLGSGIDVCYPSQNRKLMDKIIDVGAVITEYPPHTPPTGSNFPVRNRLISALSPATVVVEADKNSGALITARRALKQGKTLFAFPGPVKNFSTEGTNQLLTEGARVATCAIDVLEQFLDIFGHTINLSASKERPTFEKTLKVATSFNTDSFYGQSSDESKKVAAEPKKEIIKETFDTSNLTPEQKQVYDAMEFNKSNSQDKLIELGFEPSKLASTLMMLEIAGAIESIPGGYYIKK